MFLALSHSFYKTLILLFFGMGLSPSAASADPSEDEQNSCGITVDNISKKKKQISGLKNQCQKDYEKVQSYCTERGLATIQMISIGGQTVANAINILKADGKPESAKKAMGMSKNLSYGLGALNAGVGAKCLANISSCSSSCDSAEKTKECLETVKNTAAATATPANTAVTSIAEKLIAKLDKVDGHKLACKQLKSNAYAALAQGALHGTTGLIQAQMEKNLGREAESDKESSAESEAFNPPEPNPPETPTLSGEPGVNLNDVTDKASDSTEAGQFAGNQINQESPTESDDFEDGYRDMDSVSESPGAFVGGSYPGSSGSPSGSSIGGNIPLSAGQEATGSDNSTEGEEGSQWRRNYGNEGAGSFSGSGFSGGGSDSGGDDYYDDDDGYYDEPLGGDLKKEDSEEKKEEEELEQLKKSIGGKHESIFEKASKVLSNYCMEGPLKCE